MGVILGGQVVVICGGGGGGGGGGGRNTNSYAMIMFCVHVGAVNIYFGIPYGVSTQKQSSGLVAYENSTFRNLTLAVSGPLWRKWVLYSTLNVHVIQNWPMFVRLVQKNASSCRLFCHRLPGTLPR